MAFIFVAMYVARHRPYSQPAHYLHPCYYRHFGGHNCIGAYGVCTDGGSLWVTAATP